MPPFGASVSDTARMRSRLSTYQMGMLLAFGGMLAVSLDSLGVRLTKADDWDIAFWFGIFTAIAMLLLIPILSKQSFLAAMRADSTSVLASGILQACSTTLFILAIGTTTVSNTVVIYAAAPVVAAVIGRVVLGEITNSRTWVGIAGSIAGVTLIVSSSAGEGRWLGDLYAVGAVMAFATNLTIWRKFPEQNRMVAVGLGGFTMALVAWFPAHPFEMDTRAIVILAITGGVFGPGGRILVASATRYISGAQVGMFVPVETVAATAWAWLFLSEPAPRNTLIGGSVVLIAVWYGSRQAPIRTLTTLPEP